MLSIKSGLKKLALAGVAAAGLIATTTAASADWDHWRHHHRYYGGGHGSSFSVSIGSPYYGVGYRDYGDRYYGRGYYGGSYGYDNPRAFCNSSSPYYNPERCWRWKH